MTKQTHAAAGNITETITDRAIGEAVRLWTACRYDEAARHLEEFLAAGHDLDDEELVRARNNLAMVERARGRYREALAIHLDTAHLAFAPSRVSALVRGKSHNGLALTRQHLGEPDAAIIEFTAASHYYTEAGEYRLAADVENNLAVLHAEAGRADKAMEHAANALGSCPADETVRAQVEDTLALVELAAGRPEIAIDFAHSSIRTLRRLGNERLLVESTKTLVRAGRAYLRELEERSIRETLDACGWNLTRAARCLRMSREAFKHHLRRRFPRLDAERRHRTVPATDGA